MRTTELCIDEAHQTMSAITITLTIVDADLKCQLRQEHHDFEASLDYTTFVSKIQI
jgi:hypothetical protein